MSLRSELETFVGAIRFFTRLSVPGPFVVGTSPEPFAPVVLDPLGEPGDRPGVSRPANRYRRTPYQAISAPINQKTRV